MYERFTDRARTVMQLANQEAQRCNQDYIATEHLLLGLLWEGSGVAANALRNLIIDAGQLYLEIEKIVPPGPYRFRRERLPRTPRVKQVIAYAIEEAELLDAGYVGTEHLLLALLREQQGVAGLVLINIGLKSEEVRAEVLRLLGREIPTEKASKVPPRSQPVSSSAEPDNLVVLEKEAMYERFTDRARKVMQLANQEAQRFNHEYIGTEHILLGLIKEGAGVAANVLKNLEIDLRKIRLEVEKIVQSGPEMITMGKLPQTPRAKQVIEYAIYEAKSLNHNYVGTEHLLLGLLREEYGVGAQVLMNLGLKLENVREEVLNLLGHPKTPEEKNAESVVRPPRPLMFETDGTTPGEKNPASPGRNEAPPAVERERIRSLEQQFWNVRIVLGALVGTFAGVLLFASMGGIIGLLVGGVVAAVGGRILGTAAGGGAGLLLGSVHLAGDGGGLAGALLGAVVGFLIAEIGRSSQTPNKRR